MRRGSWFLVAGFLWTGFACAHGRGAAADPGTARPADVLVNVTNNYATSMEVHAIASGINYRMGTVSPGIPRQFVLQRAILGSGGMVEFLAQASGYGPRARSEQLQLVPGDIVDFVIATNLEGSTATVRK
jgi:hypothetical protein